MNESRAWRDTISLSWLFDFQQDTNSGLLTEWMLFVRLTHPPVTGRRWRVPLSVCVRLQEAMTRCWYLTSETALEVFQRGNGTNFCRRCSSVGFMVSEQSLHIRLVRWWIESEWRHSRISWSCFWLRERRSLRSTGNPPVDLKLRLSLFNIHSYTGGVLDCDGEGWADPEGGSWFTSWSVSCVGVWARDQKCERTE